MSQQQDIQNLKTLSIFHYIVCGIIFLGSSFPMLYFVIGVILVFAPVGSNASDASATKIMGSIFTLFAGTFIMFGWSTAICIALAGYKLSKIRNYNFCFIMACIQCAFFPFGTALGIPTIIVLMKPEVKKLFEDDYRN